MSVTKRINDKNIFSGSSIHLSTVPTYLFLMDYQSINQKETLVITPLKIKSATDKKMILLTFLRGKTITLYFQEDESQKHAPFLIL